MRFWRLALLSLVIPLSPVHAADVPAGRVIYILPLKDDVEQTMVYLARRGVKEAMEQKASALIIHLDTNGGRVDCTEQIIQAINRFEPRDQTYTYVDTKAFSAGAFIASSTRKIYMAPSSVIGAATPIIMGQGGGVEKMPDSVEQKMTSGIRGLARANAEQNGHNPAVFDAMIDRDLGLSIDGKVIVPPGKILTLTSKEAEKQYGTPPKPLLSNGTVGTLEALVSQIGGSNVRTVTFEMTGFERLARLITSIAPFLFTAGLILGYLEFQKPGFGIFGISAVVCFAIFFLGHYVAGLSGYGPALLFFLGAVLLIGELFLFPGLLLPGITGAVLVLAAVLFAMVDRYPGESLVPTMPQLQLPLQNLGLGLLTSFLAICLLIRLMPRRLFYSTLEAATVSGPSMPRGFGVQPGETGVALTQLRPSGTATFGDQRRDVVTEGIIVEAGSRIRVVQVDGMRVVVEPEKIS